MVGGGAARGEGFFLLGLKIWATKCNTEQYNLHATVDIYSVGCPLLTL